METFRYHDFSVSGNYLGLESNYFGAASMGPASLLSSVAMFPPTLLLHSSSSPADIINESTINLIGQNMKENDFQAQYDVSRWFGVRPAWCGATTSSSQEVPSRSLSVIFITPIMQIVAIASGYRSARTAVARSSE